MAIIVGPNDDGGRIRAQENKMLASKTLSKYPPYTSDIAVWPAKLALDAAQKQVLAHRDGRGVDVFIQLVGG